MENTNNQNNQQPRQPVVTTAKDFFFQIGSIIALYISAGSLIALLYEIINYTFPDELAYYGDPYSTGMRIAIASLIVIFPLYLYIGHHLQKDYHTYPEKRDFPIRKMLVYLTLFVATALMVGDLIALIHIFLGGEITIRFILKVFTIFAIAGLVFGYYVTDLKHPEHSQKNIRIFSIVAAALVLGSIVLGFLIMGSPRTQRLLRLDQNKINDLQVIQQQVVNFWQGKERLPQNLTELEDPLLGFVAPVDTQNKKPYEYMIMGPLSFSLCADFNLKSKEIKVGQGSELYQPKPVPDLFGQGIWDHDKGHKCFQRTIDPNFYPPHKLNF